MRVLLIGLSLMGLTGCVINTGVMPVDRTVKEIVTGEDCLWATIWPIGTLWWGGDTTVEQAIANSAPPIGKIRTVLVSDRRWPFYVEHCTVVTGETTPEATAARAKENAKWAAEQDGHLRKADERDFNDPRYNPAPTQ